MQGENKALSPLIGAGCVQFVKDWFQHLLDEDRALLVFFWKACAAVSARTDNPAARMPLEEELRCYLIQETPLVAEALHALCFLSPCDCAGVLRCARAKLTQLQKAARKRAISRDTFASVLRFLRSSSGSATDRNAVLAALVLLADARGMICLHTEKRLRTMKACQAAIGERAVNVANSLHGLIDDDLSRMVACIKFTAETEVERDAQRKRKRNEEALAQQRLDDDLRDYIESELYAPLTDLEGFSF